MQDNFNLTKFVRNNRLLNESIGGYVDLMPINRINEVEEYNVSHDDDAVGYVKNGKIVLVNRSGGFNDGEVTELTPEQAQAAVDSGRQITVVGGVRVDPNHPNFKELVNQLMAGNESMMEFEESEENLGGWDGDSENDQYDGEYDAETGPQIANEGVSEKVTNVVEKIKSAVKAASRNFNDEELEQFRTQLKDFADSGFGSF